MKSAGLPRRIRLVAWLAARELGASPALTALLVLATAAGVAFQIPNAANLAGYTAELESYGVTSGWGDVRVRPARGDRFEDATAVTAKARALPGVRAAVPVLMLPGALGHRGRFVSLPIAGLDLPAAWPPYRLVAGAPLSPNDRAGVLVGKSAADLLGLAVGDRVALRVMLARAPGAGLDGDLGRYEVVVRGIVGGVFGAFDPVYVDRAFLGAEAGTPDAASVLFLYAQPGAGAAALARAAGGLPGAAARTWMEDSPLLRASIQASAAIGGVSVGMVFFAVALPIAALLTLSVLERQRELALLAAVGFSRADVFAVTVLRALLVAAAGVACGALAGYGLVAYFERHPVFAWHSFVVRPQVTPALFARSALLIFAAAVAGALYPAWRAARLDPAPVLRDLA